MWQDGKHNNKKMTDTIHATINNIGTGALGVTALSQVPPTNNLMQIIIGVITVTIQIINFVKAHKK